MANEKALTHKSALHLFAVYKEDESIDMKATLAKCKLTIETYETSRKANLVAVKDAVEAVFNKFPGAKLNRRFIDTSVYNAMCAINPELANDPASIKLVEDRVTEFLKENPAEYVSTQGRNGGTERIVPEVKPEEEAPAVQAAE